MWAKLLTGIAIALLVSGTASAEIRIGPAPAGDSATVAMRIILHNFDPPDCPKIQTAIRLGDGSIQALCSNRERFRIFSIAGHGNVAMRCSAFERLGIKAAC